MLHHVVILLGFLFLKSHLLNLLHKRQGATIQDRHFRTIQLNETVINTAGIECCHRVFNCAYLDVAFHKNGATLGVTYQISITINDWLILYIRSLNLVSEILFCRVEHSRDELACVQSLTFQRKRAFQGLLILHLFFVF